MNTYKMIIAYDGFNYQGWQPQVHKQTIADCLQDTYKHVFKENVSILGASRTDAGVHALGQVAIFKSDLEITPHKLAFAWNNSLPHAIHIRSLEVCDTPFHPHSNVQSKTYYYHLFLERPLPFLARYGWIYPFIHEVDLSLFEKLLKLFEGTHDFRSFAKYEEEKSTVRTIFSMTVMQLPRYKALRIIIKGNSFLHFQIRRMIGCALDASRIASPLPSDYIETLLKNPGEYDRVFKVEGHGLCLREIVYKYD